MAELTAQLVSVDRLLWKGPASIVTAQTTEGEIGILPGHEPLLGQRLVRVATNGRQLRLRASLYDPVLVVEVGLCDGGVNLVGEDGVVREDCHLVADNGEEPTLYGRDDTLAVDRADGYHTVVLELPQERLVPRKAVSYTHLRAHETN